MECVLPVGRNIVSVHADKVAGSDARRLGRAIEPGAVEIAPGGTVGRRNEVQPPALFVDAFHSCSVHGATGDECFVAAAIDCPDVHPAVLFVYDQELATTVNRLRLWQAAKANGDESIVVI